MPQSGQAVEKESYYEWVSRVGLWRLIYYSVRSYLLDRATDTLEAIIFVLQKVGL